MVDHLGWDDCTCERVAEALPNYQMALLTCHGTFYEALITEESGIALANGEILRLRDLRRLDLSLDVLLMNSCVSARTRNTDSREPQGIHIALNAAGVDKVIGSLWNVWYPSGRVFTRNLFGLLARMSETSTASLVRAAILATRAIHPDPYHWAGWSLYGNHS